MINGGQGYLLVIAGISHWGYLLVIAGISRLFISKQCVENCPY